MSKKIETIGLILCSIAGGLAIYSGGGLIALIAVLVGVIGMALLIEKTDKK